MKPTRLFLGAVFVALCRVSVVNQLFHLGNISDDPLDSVSRSPEPCLRDLEGSLGDVKHRDPTEPEPQGLIDDRRSSATDIDQAAGPLLYSLSDPPQRDGRRRLVPAHMLRGAPRVDPCPMIRYVHMATLAEGQETISLHES